VSGGKTEELTKASTRVPFRELVSILKAWVENVGGATKDFGTSEIFAVEASLSEDLERSKVVVRAWGVIVKPGGIGHGEWPEVGVDFVGPVEMSMNEHGTSACNDSLYGTFSSAVHVLGTNARE
jgi:hypothetical protein